MKRGVDKTIASGTPRARSGGMGKLVGPSFSGALHGLAAACPGWGTDPVVNNGAAVGVTRMNRSPNLRFAKDGALIASWAMLLAAFMVALSAGPALAQTSASYALTWSTVDCGGQTFSTSTNYKLGGTVGQHDAGDPTGTTYTILGGFWVPTVVVPDPLLPEPDGFDKSRFLSFVVPTGAAAAVAEETAIAIELTTLNHMCSAESNNLFEPCTIDDDCIGGVCEAPFSASEGQLRYVNTIKTCQGDAASTGEVICRSLGDCAIDEECLQFRTCDGTTDLCATSDKCDKGVSCLASMSCPDDDFKPPFLCATTGCDPEYRDWAGDLAGGVLHVYGPGIVTARSEYNLRQIPAACAGNEASCASASEALMLATARWADMTADGATNAQDIAAASDKVKPVPEALAKPRTMLIPGILNPFRNVNVLELQNTVDAVKGLPMPGFITGPEDCGT